MKVNSVTVYSPSIDEEMHVWDNMFGSVPSNIVS